VLRLASTCSTLSALWRWPCCLQIRGAGVGEALWRGALLGLIAYATYDLIQPGHSERLAAHSGGGGHGVWEPCSHERGGAGVLLSIGIGIGSLAPYQAQRYVCHVWSR
jgi:hypothetical protein